MVVTKKPTTDPTVTLNPGDHPFIIRPSSVDYRTSVPFPASKLAKVIASPGGTLREDISPPILQKVRLGLLASSLTPNDMRRDCAALFSEIDGTDI